jgi:NAD-dependent dihydropyrimidine dehydrogenase PreA subunit
MGQLIYLKNVTTLKLDEGKCTGCGMCLSVCPQPVLSKNNGKVEIINRDACMECGACQRNCPTQALTVRPGVGCAAAVINAALGRKSSSCCTISSKESSGNLAGCSTGPRDPGCC